MTDRKLLALAALAGLGYGILEIAGVVVGGLSNPVPFDIFPTAAAAARFAATSMPAGVWLGFGLEVLSTLLLTVFVVRTFAAIRKADGHGLLATSALAAGIVNVATVFVSFGIMAARDAGAGHGLDAQSVILLAHLNWGTYFITWPSLAMFLMAFSVGAIRTHVLPGWLGWAGLVIGIGSLAGCLDPVNFGQMAQLLPILWIPGAGIALAIKRSDVPQTQAVMVPA